MFDHILVPMDGSSLAEGVLPHAAALARGGAPRISLLRILDSSRAATQPGPVDPFDWQIRRAEAETYLRDIAQKMVDAGLHPETYVREGNAAEAVIEFAHQNDADLILMSSHGQSGISGWNISSVVQKVILRAHRSVMIVRAYQTEPVEIGELRYKRILLPLDGSQRAESVLPEVSALAQNHEGVIVAAHVVHRPEMPRRTPPSQEDIALAEQLIERNRREITNYIADLQNRLNVELAIRIVVSDQVTTSLHQIAEEENVDLVVMAAHGYSGESKWPYGTVVISFISYGTNPLLVFQDLPPNSIEPSKAELAAKEKGGR